MGRLVRRYIRAYQMTVVDKITLTKEVPNSITVANIQIIDATLNLAAGVVVTGAVHIAYLNSELGNASEVTQWEGIRQDMASDALSVVNSIYCIHLNNYIQHAPTNYCYMRFSENGGATIRAAFYMNCGGGSDMTNLFRLASNTTAWSVVADPPGGAQGRIAVEVGGVQKYIQLYNI